MPIKASVLVGGSLPSGRLFTIAVGYVCSGGVLDAVRALDKLFDFDAVDSFGGTGVPSEIRVCSVASSVELALVVSVDRTVAVASVVAIVGLADVGSAIVAEVCTSNPACCFSHASASP